MKLSELRRAVPYMPEDEIVSLYCLYETLQDRTEADEGKYKAKIKVLDAEIGKKDRLLVNPALSKKIGFWETL